MPPKLPGAPVQQTGATTPHPPSAAVTTPAAHPPQAPANYGGFRPSGGGLAPPPPPADGEDDGGGERRETRYAKDFAPLTAGEHTFICCVGNILDFGYGASVGWSVVAGPERDREIAWQQTPPPFCYPKAQDEESVRKAARSMRFWFGDLCRTYAAAGHPFDGDTWFDTNEKTPDGKPIKVPPYWAFFVHECADGVHVPILFDVKVKVDAGYETRPKVVLVSPHIINGRPVQAPMPRKVMAGIENVHRWVGTPETITIQKGDRAGHVVNAVKLDWKQIALGHGGLATYRAVQR